MNNFDGYMRNIFSDDTLVLNVIMDNPSYLSNMKDYVHAAPYVDSDYHNKTPMDMRTARQLVDFVYGLDTNVIVVLQVEQLAGNHKQIEYIVNELHWVNVYLACNEAYDFNTLFAMFPIYKPTLLPSRIETPKFKRFAKHFRFTTFTKLPAAKYMDAQGKLHKLRGYKKQPRVHNNVCHAGMTINPAGHIFLCPNIAINGTLGNEYAHIADEDATNLNAYSTSICAFNMCRHGIDIRVMNMKQHSIYSHNKGNIKT